MSATRLSPREARREYARRNRVGGLAGPDRYPRTFRLTKKRIEHGHRLWESIARLAAAGDPWAAEVLEQRDRARAALRQVFLDIRREMGAEEEQWAAFLALARGEGCG